MPVIRNNNRHFLNSNHLRPHSGQIFLSYSIIMSQDAVHTQLLKTKMCKYFPAGRCIKGEQCSHAHSRDELLSKPDFRKTSLCRSFMNTGLCVSGKKCQYAHGYDELRSCTNSIVSDAPSCPSSTTATPPSIIDNNCNVSLPTNNDKPVLPIRTVTSETRCSDTGILRSESTLSTETLTLPPLLRPVSSPVVKQLGGREPRSQYVSQQDYYPYQPSYYYYPQAHPVSEPKDNDDSTPRSIIDSLVMY